MSRVMSCKIWYNRFKFEIHNSSQTLLVMIILNLPSTDSDPLRLYADDTTLYASDVSQMALQFVVKKGLSRLSEWFELNYLLINNAKTQALPIGPCKYKFDLSLNGSGVTKLPGLASWP